jgi:molybdopterin-biosynthesis enzyme MoeA-like protein
MAGGSVRRITTVGDKLDEISNSVKEALRRRPDALITTGGIGPTFDDMTLKGVARALGLRIKLSKTAVEMIQKHYERRFHRRIIKLNKPRLKMAQIPSGSTPIPNPVGTAPGVWLKVGRTQVFCLPGVPSEAKGIFVDTVSKIISAQAGGNTFTEQWLKVVGLMESRLAPIIDQVMLHWPGVYIKSHPRGFEASSRPRIELHLSTFSKTPKKAEESVSRAVAEIRRELRSRGAKVDVIA